MFILFILCILNLNCRKDFNNDVDFSYRKNSISIVVGGDVQLDLKYEGAVLLHLIIKDRFLKKLKIK